MFPPRTSFICCIVAAALLAGCATQPKTTAKASVPAAAMVFTEPVIQPSAASAVRPAVHKAYYVGRIVDPKYPELMYGNGIVFRRERAASWNTSTAAIDTPADAMSGPLRSLPDGSETPGMTPADAEIHEARTSAIVDALLEQNAELAQQLATASKTAAPPSERPINVQALPVAPTMSTPTHSPEPPPSAPTEPLVTIAPSADNIIELSPALLEPPIPGLTNPFRQRYQFETQLRETKIVVSGIALGPQPSCVLGDRIFNLGDAFESFTVAGIDADGIFLRKESFLLRIPMQEAAVVLRYP